MSAGKKRTNGFIVSYAIYAYEFLQPLQTVLFFRIKFMKVQHSNAAV